VDGENGPVRSGPRRLRPGEWIAIVLALAVLGAAGYFLLGRKPPPSAEVPPAPAAQAPSPPAAPAPPPGPEPAAGPADARALLERASDDAAFRRWLSEGDLVRRWVVVTDNLAEGVSPREALAFLAPPGKFSVEQAGGDTIIARASYARYDRFAQAVGSIDAGAAARAYRALHGVLEAAYRALGYPNASLDRVTARALSRIERAPVRDEPVPVLDESGVFVFADPALERLGAVEKHLLRMGPRNTRLLQEKAREVREALGLRALPPGRGP
jgi:hypothetical protein